MNFQLTRRQFLKGTGTTVTGLALTALAGCQPDAPAAAPAGDAAAGGATAPTGDLVNALGKVFPADALPLEQQIWREKVGQTGGGFGHIMESLYNRAFEHCGGAETLTSLDQDFNVVGVGAERWQAAEDGTYWDFFLRKGLLFSDGTPITAHDWIYTMQYSLSHNYDFGWYYFDIKNAQKVLAGEAQPEELGMEAVDDFTLRVHTESPVAYLPAVFGWFQVAKKGIWEDVGENWALDPARYISSGPYTLTEFTRDVSHRWELNTNYKGTRVPYFLEIREESLPTGLAAYIAGDITSYSVGPATPAAERQLIESNPVLKNEMSKGIAVSTDYIGFNTTGKFAPLDNPDVRLALCKAIDKDTLIQEIFQGYSYTGWGLIPTGFPNNQDDALKTLAPNVYDPEAARQLLANAGYPDGKDFPTFELWIRQPNDTQLALCEAIQARLKENLGITIELRPSDFQSFTSNLKENEPLYYVGYAMDYLDPATFMNVWRSTGRHPHSDPAWDEFYTAANSILDDPAKRFEQLREAEKRLVESTAWYFLQHPYSVDLLPCNLKGEWATANKDGFVFKSGPVGVPNAREGIYWAEASCRDGI
jgi:ABC-type transport system substrate-binding protein